MNNFFRAMLGVLVMAMLGTVSAQPGAATGQENPMRKLDQMKGVWVGEAHGIGPDRQPYSVVQTERVGSMLGGDVLVIEGRGYKGDGALAFSAFGTVSFDAKTGAYEFRAHTQGRSGTFRMEVTDTKTIWEIPAGPTAVIRYTITIKDGVWHEVGEFLAQGQPPRQITELNLKRQGDTDWPAANPVKP